MFSGIVEEMGRVKAVQGNKLIVQARKVLEGAKVGDSINLNGTCLTITSLDKGAFSVEVMPETLRRTNLGQLRPGDWVNLERALTYGGRIGGHLVQGHIDATGRIISIIKEDRSMVLKISAPRQLLPYIVEKGFIAVEGVSLTVVEVKDSSFIVSLVPYTIENTNLGKKRVGDLVNLEVDIVSKYIKNLLGR